MRKGISIAAAAMALLAAGFNQAGLDQVAPIKDFSPRQRRKIVSTARAKVIIQTSEQKIINRMTNWQRNQLGKAGYPKDELSLLRYSTLERPKKTS